MAIGNGAYIIESWANLKENPIFKRSMMPRSVRTVVRSPLVRATGFSIVAVLIFRALQDVLPGWWFGITSAVAFWTIVTVIQHYFCWAELMRLCVTGTMDDYLNSGFSPEDILIGLIYPAVISGIISYIIFFLLFLFQADSTPMRIFFGVLIFFMIRKIFSTPAIFYPDVEDYLRSRSVLALWFIGLSTFVPILMWFAIYFPVVFGVLHLVLYLGMKPRVDMIVIGSFIVCSFLIRYPQRKFHEWRLKRFYTRYHSIEELLRKFQEQKGLG